MTLPEGLKRIAVLVVAAGSGQRARANGEADVAKQYRVLAGRPVLARAIEPFLRHPAITDILVAINPDDIANYQAAVGGFAGNPKLHEPVAGGATRQATVRLGLATLSGRPPDFILVHDAARPFVDSKTIDAVLDALREVPAAVPAAAATDTLLEADSQGFLKGAIDRTKIWRAQTPQGFRYALLRAAHYRFGAGDTAFTDDATLMAAAGHVVRIVPSDAGNIKLTTPGDFEMAETRLAGDTVPDIRVGHGFDVHKFRDGDHVWLCGVKVPHDRGVEAHSDGDVALHALTDAILGALADGDIGQHFRNSDPRWRCASSDRFVADALRRLRDRGGRLANVDITILAEAPKIGPHREAMRARLSSILNLPPDRIGLKATTTETLGFVGRRDGLAAMATATLVFQRSAP